MRRLVAALIVVAFALSLTGCGGGGTAASTSTEPAATTAAASTTTGGSSTTLLPGDINRSENETTTFAPFPTGENVPADLKQKITVEKQPTLIYFYDSGQQTSKEDRAIIDAVRADNRGLVDLVTYDIGRYLTVAPDGSVTVNQALIKDPAASAAVKLARDPAIDVSFTPFVVLTDGQGFIIYKRNGLLDKAFLEREVLRASR
jgi:hypothetical protein